MVEYYGVLTATLVYDRVPVLDYLRAIDSDTIVAAVEHRGLVNQHDYARCVAALNRNDRRILQDCIQLINVLVKPSPSFTWPTVEFTQHAGALADNRFEFVCG